MLQSLLGTLVQVCITENIILEGTLTDIKDDLLIIVNKNEIKLVKNFLYISPVYPSSAYTSALCFSTNLPNS